MLQTWREHKSGAWRGGEINREKDEQNMTTTDLEKRQKMASLTSCVYSFLFFRVYINYTFKEESKVSVKLMFDEEGEIFPMIEKK